MSKHMSERPKKWAPWIAACIAVVLVIGGVAAAMLLPKYEQKPSDNQQQQVPQQTEQKQEVQSIDASTASSLPFSIDGVPTTDAVTDAGINAPQANVSGTWTFGGDYIQIGSFPIDFQTVFGSCTKTPDDIYSYTAALISQSGANKLEDSQTAEPFYEPLDGTGDSNRIVWKSSQVTNLPTNTTDNWRIQVWSKAEGRSKVLGTADALNATDQTPLLDGEVVPTANDSYAFFASMTSRGDGWQPSVLAYSLDAESSDPNVLGIGCYPAATEGGCVWAGDYRKLDSGANIYEALYDWNGTESSRLFSLTSKEGTWTISGAWAYGDKRTVAFSSDDATRGCYIGIWDDKFSTFVGWTHTSSPRVVGSMNADYFVWGAGSEADNAQMFAAKLDGLQIFSLGNAPGYSRPSIAQDNDTVIVPQSDGSSPVTFIIGTLN